MVGTTATFIEQFLPDENLIKISYYKEKIQNKPKVIFKPNIIGIFRREMDNLDVRNQLQKIEF